MLRRLAIAAATAALAGPAGPARAQFQPVIMKTPAWPGAELAGGRWSGGAGSDLLVLLAGGAAPAKLLAHHDLLTEFASPYAAPGSVHVGAVGFFDGDPAGSAPDVAWNPGISTSLAVTWGEAPSVVETFPSVFTRWVDGFAAVRLLPRELPVVVAAEGPDELAVDRITAVDLLGARGAAPAVTAKRSWSTPAFGFAADGDVYDRIFPLRISPGARVGGVEDAVVPLAQGFVLLWHDAPPASTDLAALAVSAIDFGTPSVGGLGPWLPAELATSFPGGSCLGAAAADVDGDGAPDLVFSYGSVYFGAPPGALLWIRNTGDGASMKAQRPWGLLSGRADLAAIESAGTLRQLELDGGEPAFVVNDRARETLLVARGGGALGFSLTELPLTGAELANAVALDVVGSPARDLVALVDLAPNYTTSEVWVFPDVGDRAPQLAWSPAPPPTTPLGQDLTLAVDASDPDAPPLSLRWIRPPAADVLDVSSTTIDGATLCDPSVPIDVDVRAMDALGVYVTVGARIVVEERPSLRFAGAAPPGRIELLPGGTTVRVEGSAWPKCGGTPVFEWGQVGLDGAIWGPPQQAGAEGWTDLTLPESAYAAALDGTASVTLRARDGSTLPARDGTAVLDLLPDGRGLVSAALAFDEVALEPGALGVARVRLASRLGVPLPGVLARVRLEGLRFAGPMTVEGAPASPGPSEGEIVVDPLPAEGTTVEIRVPVRAVGGAGGASVELFSSGGVRLSPEASPPSGGAPLPGCGCGGGDGAPGSALVAALLALSLRRRRREGPAT